MSTNCVVKGSWLHTRVSIPKHFHWLPAEIQMDLGSIWPEHVSPPIWTGFFRSDELSLGQVGRPWIVPVDCPPELKTTDPRVIWITLFERDLFCGLLGHLPIMWLRSKYPKMYFGSPVVLVSPLRGVSFQLRRTVASLRREKFSRPPCCGPSLSREARTRAWSSQRGVHRYFQE